MTRNSKTTKIGDKGEQLNLKILESKGFQILQSQNDDDKYDCIAEKNNIEYSFECKAEPQASLYNAFYMEVGSLYDNHRDNGLLTLKYNNKRIYQSGISRCRADIVFLTDLTDYLYVPSSRLKKKIRQIWDEQYYRFKWGGFDNKTFGISITIDELIPLSIYHSKNISN